ncbi:cytochrome b-c1 complex subunit Rieske, mitochondrial-like [Mya arenaria]|uniref:cytochrome b-c1 complex subunit Rieske, mitochondrial-like n=1 Tax=Mya arenaria TaxID=6604 RepID=UPI0022E685D3|nr:cytochrome b-c1 complex subunit Rieske, mitochondrial-like [Mya arenaria]
MIAAQKIAGLTATTQVVPNFIAPVVPLLTKHLEKIYVPKAKPGIQPLPKAAFLASAQITGPAQVRYSHTDIRVPKLDDYRRPSNVSNTDKNEGGPQAKTFTYIFAGGFGAAGALLGKDVVNGVISYISAAKDIVALAKIEIGLSDIPEGKTMTFKWQGKPLFVRHRTADEIEEVRSVDMAALRDPQPDEERTQNPKWLICIGICTHLGCVPVAEAGDFNGYYCPCHGSHYDASGRIRKGPAPLNLDIPYYEFMDDETVVVGQ